MTQHAKHDAAQARGAPVPEAELTRPPRPHGGWSISLSPLDKAQILPAPAKPPLTFPTGVLTAAGAPVPQAAVWRNRRCITLPPKPAQNLTPLEGTWLWGGLLYAHFGHFMCESTTRLWALDHLDTPVDGVLFVSKFAPEDGLASYHRDFLRLMGCDLPVHIVDRPVSVERLIVPGQGFGLGEMAAGTAPFRAAIQSRFATGVAPRGDEKLYISRSAIGPRRGGLLFETVLEDHLRTQGYTIFHPQKHPLEEQIARYKAARHILAAEGSALHLLAMVARRDQRIGMILRRRSGATDTISLHLRSFAGQAPDQIEAISRTWMPAEGGRKHMSVAELDFPVLQRQLRGLGYIADGPDWPAIPDATARQEVHSARFRRMMNYQPTAYQSAP
ncbi:glycosyltransferase family 61 protein [Mesobacterium sp. TK19101]|uniref:Glycosyltransferase family 61 protein n=1 Tax=Mesobacterium hydrothermale TaxID=3111907 RepID=A0ABU6HMI5_9RHOB|nr:glycosyltransferase family 61 protein [Mesobacterium sp. TK19101]MEC3862400.1 glycosyltransferase family 61 protein [Mesobacterium sp. TK19101]